MPGVVLAITRLQGPAKWTYFYLYVMLDIFSRFVVGWLLARREGQALAEDLIAAWINPTQDKAREDEAPPPVAPAQLGVDTDDLH